MNKSMESTRLLYELALNSGKKCKSSQTGYIHYCYHPVENEPFLPIPLIENFYFALALLKSRTIENIQEAKTILEGLLHFQNKQEDNLFKGNFPIYLHEYPACKDRFTSAHIASVMIWILKQFHQVIGQDLKKKLENSLVLAVKQALNAYAEKNASYPNAIKIACASIAAGQLTGDEQLRRYGLDMLEVLKTNPEKTSWFCPTAMGTMIASLLMVYTKLSDSPWKLFWEHLQTTWHRGTACYAGPGAKEWQQGEEPQVTLYDLFCGYCSENFSERMLKESSVHLEAVLIPTMDERFREAAYPFDHNGTINGVKWQLHQQEHLAYSYMEKRALETQPIYEKGFHTFKLLWGNQKHLHSLVCQGDNATTVFFDGTDLIFELDRAAEVEDREKAREILFFWDQHEEMEFFVSGKKASIFTLGEIITLKNSGLTLSLSFHLEQGEGRFLGHRMPGNRPSQIAAKGIAKFNAYDWQLFLRTLNRTDKCRLRVKLKIQSDA
jgi:hypothetical protein